MRYTTDMPSISAFTVNERPGTVWTQLNATVKIKTRFFEVSDNRKDANHDLSLSFTVRVSFFGLGASLFGLYLMWRVESADLVLS